mmetsp:Transcript_2845/g.5920  ORF Transcript_2845/g.5920 Transcript_2845/m.5920 type:complete len:429 (-) Transcript_2845:244-1530(-)
MVALLRALLPVLPLLAVPLLVLVPLLLLPPLPPVVVVVVVVAVRLAALLLLLLALLALLPGLRLCRELLHVRLQRPLRGGGVVQRLVGGGALQLALQLRPSARRRHGAVARQVVLEVLQGALFALEGLLLLLLAAVHEVLEDERHVVLADGLELLPDAALRLPQLRRHLLPRRRRGHLKLGQLQRVLHARLVCLQPLGELLDDILEELAGAGPPRVGAHGLVGVLVLAEEEVLLPGGARGDAVALHVLLQQRLERRPVLRLLPLLRRLLLQLLLLGVALEVAHVVGEHLEAHAGVEGAEGGLPLEALHHLAPLAVHLHAARLLQQLAERRAPLLPLLLPLLLLPRRQLHHVLREELLAVPHRLDVRPPRVPLQQVRRLRAARRALELRALPQHRRERFPVLLDFEAAVLLLLLDGVHLPLVEAALLLP